MLDEVLEAWLEFLQSERRGGRKRIVYNPVTPIPVGKPYTPPPESSLVEFPVDVAKQAIDWGNKLKEDFDKGAFQRVEQLTEGRIKASQLDKMEEAQKRKKVEGLILGAAANKVTVEALDKFLTPGKAGSGEEAALQRQEEEARAARRAYFDSTSLVRRMVAAGASYSAGQAHLPKQPVRSGVVYGPGDTEPDPSLVAPLAPMEDADP